MNVCGGHERSIAMAGLRAVVGQQLTLIPGPGCPVCVCPEEDIYFAIQIALHTNTTVVAFGDMLRVPVNVKINQVRSLMEAKTNGADVRAVASPAEAIAIAQQTDKRVVFFAAGFETTMAPLAAMLAQPLPDNLSILLSGRRTWPVVESLLAQDSVGFDALIAPGHVATIMGAHEWRAVADKYHIAIAMSGFTPEHLLTALASVIKQYHESLPQLDNCYPEVVTEHGNPTAKRYLTSTMTVVDANWRGIGIIADSGFAINNTQLDARHQFKFEDTRQRHVGEMPAGCACAQVVLGNKLPNECVLYDQGCSPRAPIGPCMVSDEGACRIWWSAGTRRSASKKRRPESRSINTG
jgi:hydrogenase expression/formation protein HypD